MDTEAEAKLRKEVQYLTRLIDAHKAIQKLQKEKTNPSPVASQGLSTASSTVSSRQTASHTTKPENLFKWSNSHKGTKERRVVLAPSWSNPGSITAHTISSISQDTTTVAAHITSQPRKRRLKFGNKVFVPQHSQTSLSSMNSQVTTCASASRISKNYFKTVEGCSSSQQVSVTSSKAGGGITSSIVRSLPMKRTLPDKSQLQWRRNPPLDGRKDTNQTRTDSSSSSTARKPRKRVRTISNSSQQGGLSLSPFIVRRYKLTRISSPKTTPTSFSQRRRSYMLKHSLSTPVAGGGERRSKHSVHRVWTATGNHIPAAGDGGVMMGHEVKTRQGNRQWVANRLPSGIPVPKKRKRSLTEQQGDTPHSSRKKRRSMSTSRERGKRKRLLSIEGRKFIVLSGGKKLRHLTDTVENSHEGAKTPSPKRTRLPSSTRLSTVKRKLASHVVQRSVNRVWLAKQTSKRREEKAAGQNGPKQFCTYYNRFGRCNRGADCPFVHDPKRVAICSKFLRGKCDKTDKECPFSHSLSKEKMPVCSFFLRGLCTREACPYLHVSVAKDAALCPDFLRGFCSLGEKCTKKHVLDCPDYQSGECPRGRTCPLRHFKRSRKRTSGSVSQEEGAKRKISRKETRRTVTATKEPGAFRRLRHKLESKQLQLNTDNHTSSITPVQLDFIPLDTDKAPEFIAL